MKKVHFLMVVALPLFLISCGCNNKEQEEEFVKVVKRISLLSSDTGVTIYTTEGTILQFAKPVPMAELAVAGIDPIAIAEADAHKGEVVFFPKKTIPEKIKEEIGDEWYSTIVGFASIILSCLAVYLLLKIG